MKLKEIGIKHTVLEADEVVDFPYQYKTYFKLSLIKLTWK